MCLVEAEQYRQPNFPFKFILFNYLLNVDLQNLPNAATPRVGIVMGSDSDLPVMKDAARILTNFGVPHEVTFLTYNSFCLTLYIVLFIHHWNRNLLLDDTLQKNCS